MKARFAHIIMQTAIAYIATEASANERVLIKKETLEIMPVPLSELDLALDYSSFDSLVGDHYVYLNRMTGQLYYDSDASEDEIPEDVDDSKKYLLIPTKQDLGLGKPLVLEFVSEYLPEHVNEVHAIFSRKGAYQRYKALLCTLEKLEDWYQYEAEKQKEALINWCEENDIEVSI